MQLVSAIRVVRQHKYWGWLISLAALGICLFLRIYIREYGDFLGAGAFLPAVMIAALFGGIVEGITVFIISVFVLFFFFVPPYLSFQIERSRDAVGLSLFVVTGSIALYLISTLNKAVDISHGHAEDALVMQRRTATLFAELQHRVANNLAFLVAVVNIQAREFGNDGSVAVALEAVRERLMAMSRSHRRLYDPTKIDRPFGEYLGELCSEQIAISGQPVTHTVACDPIVLELDQMIPAGLIVSELVTNCLKHGFKGRSHGHIAISLRQTPELNECVLTVSDDGCSNAGSSDGKAGLGKIIVNGLAAQLRAKISCERGSGTSVTLKFPMPEPVHHQPNTCARAALQS